MPTLSLVAMSDELPPPPVSNTRASQIAVNFAARVKHQMKDERKQVARFPHCTPQPHQQACWDTHTCSPALPGARQWTELEKELASEAVRKVEKLMRRCCCCSTCLRHTLTTPSREALATLLRASTHRVLRLTAHRPPFALCRAQRGQEARQGQGERRRGPHPAPVTYRDHACSGG